MRNLHGVTTSSDLEAEGISLKRLRRMPEYERLADGYYAMPGARRDFWFWASFAIQVAGDDARLTAASCLYAHGVLDRAPEVVHVAVPEGKGSRKRRDFDVRRSSHLPDVALTRFRLPTTPIAYAIGDHARDVGDKALSYAISRAVAKRMTTLTEITRVADERGKFPGSARLRRVLADFGEETTHSNRERKLRAALRELGYVAHPEPLDVLDADGRTVGQADIAFTDIHLDIEVDGPHHLLPEQQAADRQRDRRMKGVDWHVVRYLTYEIDEDVHRVAREIAALIDEMRARTAQAA